MFRMETAQENLWAALICIAVAFWSIAPANSHAPAVFETIQDHLEMIADHGHSHGFEEDLYWAMHGHSHDAADHDHSQAFLVAQVGAALPEAPKDIWRLKASPGADDLRNRIDRPPQM